MGEDLMRLHLVSDAQFCSPNLRKERFGLLGVGLFVKQPKAGAKLHLRQKTDHQQVSEMCCFISKALALCQYFETEGIRFPDMKVIELGAGTGILSILVALLGGDVTITDQPALLRQIERNVSFNIPSSFKPRVKVRALCWGRDHTLFPSDYDYILGSDIMYFYETIPLILQTLLHLSNENTVVYFASRMAYGQKMIGYGYVIMSRYFKTELVCRYEVKDINVYRMVRKTPTPGDLIE
ncbi:EEF1A lysine methyltransferase 3-like [Mustelus asterias]